jgi:hypothetical protein
MHAKKAILGASSGRPSQPVHHLDDAAQALGLRRQPAGSQVRGGEELQRCQDGCHLGEPNADGPFDELGLHICHLASQIGNVGLRCDIRQVNIDRLLDGRCELFGLGVCEAGGREALDRLVDVEGAYQRSLKGYPAGEP